MNRKKTICKSIAMFMVCLLCFLSGIPTTTSQALAYEEWEDISTGITWKYIPSGEDATFVYTDDVITNEELTLPNRVGDGHLLVVSIGYNSASSTATQRVIPNASNVTDLTIPAGVETIHDYAFRGNATLQNIHLPNTITEIGKWAFHTCSRLTTIDITDIETKKPTISLGACSFANCSNLISLPAWNIRSFSNEKSSTIGVFSGCSALKNVDLTASTFTDIPEYTFMNCTSLKTITLPDTCYLIDGEYRNNSHYGALSGCTSLTTITGSHVGKLGPDALAGNTKLSTLNLPNLSIIGEYAFMNCSSLQSFDFTNISVIGKQAFNGCSSLSSVDVSNVENFVTSVANNQEDKDGKYFQNCTSLTSVVWSNTVPFITGFYGCTNLTSVTIPDTVDTIGQNAFYSCNSLSRVILPAHCTAIENSAFYNCSSLRAISLPDSVSVVEASAFAGSGLISIDLNQVQTLNGNTGYGPFGNCTSLKTIQLSPAITELPYQFCRGATSLTTITPANQITSIGDSALYGCTSFRNIEDFTNLISIGKEAFSGCTGFSRVVVPAKVETIGDKSFYNCNQMTLLDLSNTKITTLPSGICAGTTNPAMKLEDVKLPETLTTISSTSPMPFDKCTKLTEIEIPASVTSLTTTNFFNSQTNATIIIRGTTALDNNKFNAGHQIALPKNHPNFSAITKTKGYMAILHANDSSGRETRTFLPYEHEEVCTPVSSTGKEFVCWNTSATGDGAAYNTGDVIPEPETGNVECHLYAVWSAEDAPTAILTSETSTENSQNLKCRMTDNTMVAAYYLGPIASASDVPTSAWTKVSKKSYQITKSVASAGDYYLHVKDNAGNITSSSSVTIVAMSLNPNGGTYTWNGVETTDSITVYRTKYAVIILPEAEKGIALFDGWGENHELGEYTLTGNVSLVANYNTELTIHYNANGGDGSMPDTTVSFDDAETVIPSIVFTKTGYHTTELNTAANGDGTTVRPGDLIQTLTGRKVSEITLYAVWNQKQSNLTFDGLTDIISVTYDEAVGTLPSPTKTGYVFSGWFDGNTEITSETVCDWTDDRKLTAKWTPKTSTLSFNTVPAIANKTVTYGQTVGELEVPAKTGHTFSHYIDAENTQITKDTIVTWVTNKTLTPVFTPSRYQITYLSETGETLHSQTVTYGQAIGTLYSAPAKEGHRFIKWTVNDTELKSTDTYLRTENCTAVPTYSINTYKLSFDACGGTCDTASKMVTYHAHMGELPEPTLEGYTFSGWKLYDNTKVTSTTRMPASATTLYATYTASANSDYKNVQPLGEDKVVSASNINDILPDNPDSVVSSDETILAYEDGELIIYDNGTVYLTIVKDGVICVYKIIIDGDNVTYRLISQMSEAVPTNTPAPTLVPTATPINTLAPTPTETPTATPIPMGTAVHQTKLNINSFYPVPATLIDSTNTDVLSIENNLFVIKGTGTTFVKLTKADVTYEYKVMVAEDTFAYTCTGMYTSAYPTATPTVTPTTTPTEIPTEAPTLAPTIVPTPVPTATLVPMGEQVETTKADINSFYPVPATLLLSTNEDVLTIASNQFVIQSTGTTYVRLTHENQILDYKVIVTEEGFSYIQIGCQTELFPVMTATPTEAPPIAPSEEPTVIPTAASTNPPASTGIPIGREIHSSWDDFTSHLPASSGAISSDENILSARDDALTPGAPGTVTLTIVKDGITYVYEVTINEDGTVAYQLISQYKKLPATPSPIPTEAPTEVSTEAPTITPTATPTEIPTEEPTEEPTEIEIPTSSPLYSEPTNTVLTDSSITGTPANSSDESVAKIEDGQIILTGKDGETNITVTDKDGKTLVYRIVVTNGIPLITLLTSGSTTNNTTNHTTNNNSDTNNTVKKPQMVTSVTKGNVVYKIKGKSIIVQKVTKKNVKKITIVNAVKINGKTYKVTVIAANALKNCKKLKKIKIKAKSLKSVGKNAIKGVHKKCVIKIMKKKQKKLFKKSTGFKKSMKIK